MINILIAEDSAILREKLKVILSFEQDFQVLGSVASGNEAVAFVKSQRPDVILMDIEMECKADGIDATLAIHQMDPSIKIIMLTVQEDENSILQSFASGAIDYVMKTASSKEIIESIHSANFDCSPIRPLVATTVRKGIMKYTESKDSMLFIVNLVSKLTPSEIEIIKYLAQGKKQHEIASLKHLEVSTIKTHVRNILRKFQVKRTKEMIALLEHNNALDIIMQINE